MNVCRILIAALVLSAVWMPAEAEEAGRLPFSGLWLGMVVENDQEIPLLVRVAPGARGLDASVTILDGPRKDLRADADATLMTDGTLRLEFTFESEGPRAVLDLHVPAQELFGRVTAPGATAPTPMLLSRVTPEVARYLGLETGAAPRAKTARAVEAPADETADPVETALLNMAATWKQAFETHDVPGIMAQVAEDFSHPEWRDKPALRDFITALIDQGLMDGVRLDVSHTRVDRNEDGSYLVHPVELSALFGSATLRCTVERRDESYAITTLSFSGIPGR